MGTSIPDWQRIVLEAALRAPSAHNTQPWRLSPLGDGSYLLWYDGANRLLSDPDDRDGLLAMGCFFETLRLAANAHGVEVDLEPTVELCSVGIRLGRLGLTRRQAAGADDPLAASIGGRHCNRSAYEARPLPPGLSTALAEQGCVLLAPAVIAPLVLRASLLAWRDPRFVSDLERWTRLSGQSSDGMTSDCLGLNSVDQWGLRLAFRLGRLPAWLARVYAAHDVKLTRASSVVAVLPTSDRMPLTLFDCGRRLLRTWTLINSWGYSWQPLSVVIDQPTAKELSGLIGGRDPVAIFRVGYTALPAPWSGRRDLGEVVVPTPDGLARTDQRATM